MTKQTHLTVRLTPGETTRIAAAADAAGLSVSAWTRQALDARLHLEQLAAGLARDLAADAQAQAADLDSKLRLISDQIAALSKIVTEARK